MFEELKEELAEQQEEWKTTREEFLAPTYHKIGEYLRMLQNEGMSISEMAENWGTSNRSTIYKFLAYATTPHNGLRTRRSFNKETTKPKYLQPVNPSPLKLQDFLRRIDTTDPNVVTVETRSPVPPELWPRDKHGFEYPTEDWTGTATWENNILITDLKTSGPLHAAQKTLGGIGMLTA